jgi:hypothetical protein
MPVMQENTLLLFLIRLPEMQLQHPFQYSLLLDIDYPVVYQDEQ